VGRDYGGRRGRRSCASPLHWRISPQSEDDHFIGLSAYRGDGCWLLVTYGLTELYEKLSDDPGTSGWGYELTMRVPADDPQPPRWALRLMEKLGRVVDSGEMPLGRGHRLQPGGPITGAQDTRLTALAFSADPRLPEFDSANGHAAFLTMVGITAGELARMKATSTAGVLAEIAAGSPLLITDVTR
jgi:hypothetical protein